MKYLRYFGLYLIIIVIGNNVLKIAEADKVWTALFYGGAVLWYMASVCEKDS